MLNAVAYTQAEFGNLMQTMREDKVRKACQKNSLQVYGYAALAPFLTTLGIVLLTIFVSAQYKHPCDFTFTATVGTYTCLSIMAIITTWGLFVSYGCDKVSKDKKFIELEVELEMLNQPLDSLNSEIALYEHGRGKQLTQEILKDYKASIEKDFDRISLERTKRWKESSQQCNDILKGIAIGLFTIVATIFASEYLPDVLTSTAAKGIAAGIFFAGGGVAFLDLSHTTLGMNEHDKGLQKTVFPYLETLAFFVIAIVGTIVAAEYLPQITHNDTVAQTGAAVFGVLSIVATLQSWHNKSCPQEYKKYSWWWNEPMVITCLAILATVLASQYIPQKLSNNFIAGTSGVVGMVGLTAAIVSLTRKIIRAVDEDNKYVDNKSGNDSGYDYNYIPGLANMPEQAKFIKEFKKIKIANTDKVMAWSWWIPLAISMIGMVIGGVTITEFASEGAAPYLYATTIIVPLVLSVFHMFYTYHTIKTKDEVIAATREAMKKLPKQNKS